MHKKGFFRLRSQLTLLALIIVLALGLVSVPVSARPVSAQGSSITFGISNNVDTLDPNVTTFSSVGVIMQHVFDPLVWQYPLGEFHPGLATEWSVNEDATEYTFKLRQGVTFHDGTPFNAEAVKFTFDRIMDPDTQSQMAFSYLGPYVETQVVDDYTAVVKFSSPYAAFLDSASQPQLGITSPTAVETLGDEYGLSMVVGTGPFKLVSYVPDSEVVLERNPDYNWGPEDIFGQSGPTNVDRLTFKIIQEPATRLAALESGEVDYIDEVPAQDVARLDEESNYKVMQIDQPGHGWSLMFNFEKSPTDELAVRQAIIMGSDKQGMIDTVFDGFGTPACSPLTKVMFAYAPLQCEQYPYDKEAAGRVLDEAGWVMNDSTGIREKDGQPLVIEHWYRADSWPGDEMATFMQYDLAQIGIEVHLNGASQSGYFDAVRSGQHNTQNWWDTQTDPGAVMRTLFHSSNADGGTNRNRYRNPKMDQLIVDAAGETDPTAQKELYIEIQQLVEDDAIMDFYVDPVLLFANDASLDGVVYLGGGYSPDFYAATLGG
jgi:peptide/nickel transport system substrate-binding protein